jgi:uncharacterized glyoxalase superfamily protein PhnB
MLVTTIHFSGTCDKAIAFYQKTFGAEIKDVMRGARVWFKRFLDK